MALLLLPSSVSTNPTSVRCLITVRQLHALPLPMYNVYGRGYRSFFLCTLHNASTFHSMLHPNDRKQARLPSPIHDRNLYLAKRLLQATMHFFNVSGVHDYVDNHTHNDRTRTGVTASSPRIWSPRTKYD